MPGRALYDDNLGLLLTWTLTEDGGTIPRQVAPYFICKASAEPVAIVQLLFPPKLPAYCPLGALQSVGFPSVGRLSPIVSSLDRYHR